MHHLGREVLAFLVAAITTCVAMPARAQAPLVPQLSYCIPRYTACNLSSTPWLCSQLKNGNDGFGYANNANERFMEIGLAYLTSTANDDPQAAIDATDKIEICKLRANGVVVCPGGAWVVFDRAANKGIPTAGSIFTTINDATANVKFNLPMASQAGQTPYIWDDLAEDEHLVLRVNDFAFPSRPGYFAALAYGACANWRALSSSTHFDIVGVGPTVNPFDPTFDVCTEGSKVKWNGTGASVGDACLRGNRAAFIAQVMEKQGSAHLNRIQATLATDAQTPPIASWLNGSSSGGSLPLRFFVGPHRGSGGNWDWGAIRINADDFNLMNPGTPPLGGGGAGAIPGDAREAFRLLTHEYFHSLQAAWGREQQKSNAHINNFISEGLAASVELNLCTVAFPGPGAANECVSAGKLGVAYKGVYQSDRILDEPAINVLQQYYSSAIFWRYVFEQYAYPVNPASVAHPSGSSPGIERDVDADTKALKDRPFSDEGIDFIGRMFKAFAQSTNSSKSWFTTSDLVGQAIDAHIGRAFEDFLLDFQTAMVLKDYTEVDPRWRFEWTHQEGYSASTRISDAKPFMPSADLYGQTCGVLPSSPGKLVCDGLTRARRLHDSWSPGLILPVPLVIPLGQGISSAQEEGIGSLGAAYVSIRPAKSNPGQKSPKLFARATALQTVHPPKFRLFRIKLDPTTGAETPVPLCGSPPDFVCPAIPGAAKAEWEMSTPVTVSSDTSELLLVVGGSQQPQKFTWSFGDVDPKLTLIEPTSSLTAFVGHSGQLRRSFIAKFTLRDTNNKPLTIGKADLTVKIHGCTDGLSVCTLSQQDFGFQGYSGGNYLLTVTLPDAVYPPQAQGSMGLELVAGEASDIENQALAFQASQRPASMVVAIDRSSVVSVPTFGLARKVAKTIVQSLLPPPGAEPISRFALVPFDQDAATLSHPALGSMLLATADTYHFFEDAIDDMEPFDPFDFRLPSLGDALFESQSVLAGFWDPLPGVGKNADQTVVLISPGFQQAGSDPITYLFGGSVANDGQGSPWTQPSSRNDRIKAGLSVPRVSTVAVGPTVDLSRLDIIARECGGTRFDVTGTPTPTFADVMDVSDAAMATYGAGSGYERVLSARTRGEPVPIAVEAGALELKVSVVSAFDGGAFGTLVSPSGDEIEPSVSTQLGDAVTYRVLDPASGNWLLDMPGPFDSVEPVVFVEASVRAPLQLFTVADVMNVRPVVEDAGELGPEDQRAFVGSDIVLRATPWQGEPVTDCTVHAVVRRPGNPVEQFILLRDDGRHQDELAGDGVYGGLFAATGSSGAYRVRTIAKCSTPDFDSLIEREKLETVVLHPLPDLNANGIVDVWEQSWGISGGGLDDPDSDGLTNQAEFDIGTNPVTSDSDSGGESDASERLAGRDPRDPDDDAIDSPELLAVAGNSTVYLPAAMSGEGVTLEVERAQDVAGPFMPLPAAQTEDAAATFDTTAENDVHACYRMRATSGQATSGWSVPSCVTPRLDPTPPQVTISRTPTSTRTRDVQLSIDYSDSTSVSDGVAEPDLAILESGVTEMRVWFGAGAPESVLWQPAEPELLLRLPDRDVTYVRVQVRDSAGNVSNVASSIITRPRSSPLERAIALEELAEDLIEAGDITGTKIAILKSLAETTAAFFDAVKLLAKTKGKSPAAVQAVALLGKVLGVKVKVLALLTSGKTALALQALKNAIADELKAAQLLDTLTGET